LEINNEDNEEKKKESKRRVKENLVEVRFLLMGSVKELEEYKKMQLILYEILMIITRKGEVNN